VRTASRLVIALGLAQLLLGLAERVQVRLASPPVLRLHLSEELRRVIGLTFQGLTGQFRIDPT
jgi:hypothetical protein